MKKFFIALGTILLVVLMAVVVYGGLGLFFGMITVFALGFFDVELNLWGTSLIYVIVFLLIGAINKR